MIDQPDPRDTPALSEEQIRFVVSLCGPPEAFAADLPLLTQGPAFVRRLLEILDEERRARVPGEACPKCAELKDRLRIKTEFSDLQVAAYQDAKFRLGAAEAKLRDLVPGPDAQAGVTLIAAERQRQVAAEGWTPAHDDSHAAAELVCAAICYAEAGSGFNLEISPSKSQAMPFLWPWEDTWWKPSIDPIRNLAKAGALIAAEIDRCLRAAPPVASETGEETR